MLQAVDWSLGAAGQDRHQSGVEEQAVDRTDLLSLHSHRLLEHAVLGLAVVLAPTAMGCPGRWTSS